MISAGQCKEIISLWRPLVWPCHHKLLLPLFSELAKCPVSKTHIPLQSPELDTDELRIIGLSEVLVVQYSTVRGSLVYMHNDVWSSLVGYFLSAMAVVTCFIVLLSKVIV